MSTDTSSTVDYRAIRNPEDVLRLAQQRSGLHEIDSDSWREGLAILLDEIHSSPLITDSGREYLISNFARVLASRLEVHDYARSAAPKCASRRSNGPSSPSGCRAQAPR